jgi:hypothetical protein
MCLVVKYRPNTSSLMAPRDEFSVPCYAFLSLRKGIFGNREVPKYFRLADEDLECNLVFVPATLGFCKGTEGISSVVG